MKVMDTDTFSLFLTGHERVKQRHRQESEQVNITFITEIEMLKGRFATVFKAADGKELELAYQRLNQTKYDLSQFCPLAITHSAADEFDKLLLIKSLKKIGRGDLLIAAIVLANRATLVTRNLKDFRLIPGLQVENWAD